MRSRRRSTKKLSFRGLINAAGAAFFLFGVAFLFIFNISLQQISEVPNEEFALDGLKRHFPMVNVDMTSDVYRSVFRWMDTSDYIRFTVTDLTVLNLILEEYSIVNDSHSLPDSSSNHPAWWLTSKDAKDLVEYERKDGLKKREGASFWLERDTGTIWFYYFSY